MKKTLLFALALIAVGCADAQRLSREWIEAHPPGGN